ncbi:hypothetical protein GGI43DRAFT_360609 [Trichoderma evansii]
MFFFFLFAIFLLHFNRSLHMLGFFLDLPIVLLFFLIGIGELKVLHLCMFGSNFVYQGARRNRNFFLYDTGIRRSRPFYYLLFIPFGKIWKDTVFSSGVGRNREARACFGQAAHCLGVWCLDCGTSNSAAIWMQCIHLPPWRETASRPCKQARRYASTRSSRAMGC